MNLTCLALQSHRSIKPNQIICDMLFSEVLKNILLYSRIMRMYLPSWIYFVLNSLKANIGGLRQKPESFYDQRYYSEAIFEFKAFDGVKRYVRFRMMPADGRPETGLLSEEVQQHPW